MTTQKRYEEICSFLEDYIFALNEFLESQKTRISKMDLPADEKQRFLEITTKKLFDGGKIFSLVIGHAMNETFGTECMQDFKKVFSDRIEFFKALWNEIEKLTA